MGDRLKLWLWTFWWEHPFILIAALALGYGAIRLYDYRRNTDFWDHGYTVTEARITDFSTVHTRRGAFTMVSVTLRDGTRTFFNATIDQVDRCRTGDQVVVKKKGRRIRPMGGCIEAVGL